MKWNEVFHMVQVICGSETLMGLKLCGMCCRIVVMLTVRTELRSTFGERSAWESAAAMEGVGLSEWMRRSMDGMAREQGIEVVEPEPIGKVDELEEEDVCTVPEVVEAVMCERCVKYGENPMCWCRG